MTLPNALSAARAVLVIPVIGLIATGDASLALLVFLGAAATDALDGPLARRRGATAFGAALDPFADKILVVGTLAALAIRGIAPAWAIVLILARELVAIEVRARAPQAIGAGADGKAKTVLQVTAIAISTTRVQLAWNARFVGNSAVRRRDSEEYDISPARGTRGDAPSSRAT